SVTVSADCTDGSVYLAGAVSVSSDGMTVTAEFAPPLPNTYCCTLAASGGATGSQDIRLLAGDVNGSGRVNATDKNFVKGEIGDPPLPPDLFTFDVNLSGRINSTDKNIVKGKISTSNVPDPSCPCTVAGGACIADAYCCPGLLCDLGGTDTCLVP
ncbi:MAG: hypothetical protein IID40_05660, partial [Planctomycetes bacterium]|nr:hypothetical protein [Planctomycetota bacterium]